MKRIATWVTAVSLAIAAGSAVADSPVSANETTSLSAAFPQMTTYADLHKNDFVSQASSPFPASANETTSLVSEFPRMTTYADLHNDNVKRASTGSTMNAM